MYMCTMLTYTPALPPIREQKLSQDKPKPFKPSSPAKLVSCTCTLNSTWKTWIVMHLYNFVRDRTTTITKCMSIQYWHLHIHVHHREHDCVTIRTQITLQCRPLILSSFIQAGGCKAGTFDVYPKHSDDPYANPKPRREGDGKVVRGNVGVFKPSPGPKTMPTSSVMQQNVIRCEYKFVHLHVHGIT